MGEQKETSAVRLDYLNSVSIIDFKTSLFDVEFILMTACPAWGWPQGVYVLDVLPSKRWVRCAVFAVYHMPYKTKVLHGYQENSTV